MLAQDSIYIFKHLGDGFFHFDRPRDVYFPGNGFLLRICCCKAAIHGPKQAVVQAIM
jgi:hypothetical protein